MSSGCICKEGYISVNDHNALTRLVQNSDFCVLAYHSALITNKVVNGIILTTITIGSNQRFDDIQVHLNGTTMDNPVQIDLENKLQIDGNTITIADLHPGNRYGIRIGVINPTGTAPETVFFPIVSSCSCDAESNPDKSGRPTEFIITQSQGHVTFTFRDNSRCGTAFAFTRINGFPEFVDDSADAIGFTNDYFFSAPSQCSADNAHISPGTVASDNLKISKLSVGSTYSYCVRATNQGQYMDLAVAGVDGRIGTSSAATCSSHTISWEASIDGQITTDPNAGSLPTEGVTVSWNLLSLDSNRILHSDSTTTDEGGAFTIEFNVFHKDLKGYNLAEVPVQIFFSKTTHGRNDDIDHKFLCNGGLEICDPIQGHIVYLMHLHFGTPLHIYDDTSIPFSGQLTVHDTPHSGQVGCPIEDAEVCLQHKNINGDLTNSVCVRSKSGGIYIAPAVIGSVIHGVQISYNSHQFEKSFKNNWNYENGLHITEGGFYAGNDFVDMSKAKLYVEGMSLCQLRIHIHQSFTYINTIKNSCWRKMQHESWKKYNTNSNSWM